MISSPASLQHRAAPAERAASRSHSFLSGAPLRVPCTRHCAAPARARAPGRGCPARRAPVTMGLFGLGVGEILVIGGVVAVLFGPSKLPDLGKSLGKTVKSFQSAAKASSPLLPWLLSA